MDSQIKIEHGYGVKKVVEGKHLVFLTWVILSLIFTLYSKWLMDNYFPYPITMSLIHMVIASILSHMFGGLVNKRLVEKTRFSSIGELSFQEKKSILVFSIIVAVNIWFSNASLHLVSISLHQMARTTIPLFTMALGILFFKHNYRLSQIPPVILVILGVAITVNGTPELSIYGLFIVFMGCCVSSLKGIVAQKLQVENLKINPIIMLQYVGPVASLTLGFFSVIFGEVQKISKQIENMDKISFLMTNVFLIFAGILAFGLNVLSLMSSTIVSPLAMNIAGNVKQLLTCLLGCFIFGNIVTDKLLLGILLTSLGALWYSLDKQKDSSKKKVRYVKGRYIDRVGLGIPNEMGTPHATRIKNKNPGSESIEIKQIVDYSKTQVIEINKEPKSNLGEDVAPKLSSQLDGMEISLEEDHHTSKEVSCYLKMESIIEEEEFQEIQVNLELGDLEEVEKRDFPLKKVADLNNNMDIIFLESGAKNSQNSDENTDYSNI
ncbi:phosphate phosphoenolpyruvate translocator with 9 transmembrane domains [Cryptosporidium sp. chipmunk genotype I]|uniref:phosphate phosphoenolpyruvate translocator with 9 transmembrane domains n=1 Tax=Cryptosporidium sp. chipmunk genotype I TaxID=1280935 RepID=UPI00351A8EF5|nr:phosphate phosphoenolpyruvate translocator with 9 transmembrane domains [Cryptosporidium sp. chipmunk genotype I]